MRPRSEASHTQTELVEAGLIRPLTAREIQELQVDEPIKQLLLKSMRAQNEKEKLLDGMIEAFKRLTKEEG